jgi:hypothetical protein
MATANSDSRLGLFFPREPSVFGGDLQRRRLVAAIRAARVRTADSRFSSDLSRLAIPTCVRVGGWRRDRLFEPAAGALIPLINNTNRNGTRLASWGAIKHLSLVTIERPPVIKNSQEQHETGSSMAEGHAMKSSARIVERRSRPICCQYALGLSAAASMLLAHQVAAAQLKLAWDWSDTSGRTPYFKVERKTGNDGTFSQVADRVVEKTYADTTVENDKTYCYRVRAYDSSGNSAYSSEACSSVPSSTSAGGTSPPASTPVEVIVDNAPSGAKDPSRSFTGYWCPSKAPNYYGADSLYNCQSTGDTYRLTPTLPTAGKYDVYVRWTSAANRSMAVPIAVRYFDATNGKALTTSRVFNQQANGGSWQQHGTYTFVAGTSGYVEVSAQNGQASADAVRFVLQR